MLARCPNCHNTFSTDRAGRQDCPVCGKPLVVPEQPQTVLPATLASESQPQQAEGTPWERREQLGLVQAWLQTMQQALFEPGKLFASARLEKGRDQLGFAVLTSSIFSAIGQLLERAALTGERNFMRRMLGSFSGNPDVARMMEKMIDPNSPSNSWAAAIGFVLFTPVVALVLLYLNAAVTHGVALILGQAKRGFAATFAACAYSCAPLVLLAVPACGWVIALVWLVVLTGIGMKETHKISSGGAAATVLAPYALFCCLIFTAGLGLGLTLRNMMAPR